MPVNHQWGLLSNDGTYENCVFSEEFETYGKIQIKNSECLGGKVMGNSLIADSILTGTPIISGANVIKRSVVADRAVVQGMCYLEDSVVMADARVYGSASATHVLIGDDAIVCGTAVIIGSLNNPIDIVGHCFVDRGVWYRAPLHYVCKSGLVVAESAHGLVNVNCITNKPSKFLSKYGRAYGKKLGMTEEEIDEVQHYVEIVEKERYKC